MTDGPIVDTLAVPVFYYRDGCHLCEDMFSVLYRGWPAVAETVEWRNVDDSPEWQAAYGLVLPVLMLGDSPVCETFPDAAQLTRYFGAPLVPV